MTGKLFSLLAVAALGCALCAPARAATFNAHVVDQDGRPVADAVVVLRGADMPAPASKLSSEKTVDQRNEVFVPLVTIVPRGGGIVFTNNDRTMHQVYSFSPVKQFEFTLNHGQATPRVTFDKTGVAAIGCNIHDHMIAYAFVTDSPWTILTGQDGRANFADIPPGNYQMTVWHPRLPPGAAPAPTQVAIGAAAGSSQIRLRLIAPKVSRHHRGDY